MIFLSITLLVNLTTSGVNVIAKPVNFNVQSLFSIPQMMFCYGVGMQYGFFNVYNEL